MFTESRKIIGELQTRIWCQDKLPFEAFPNCDETTLPAIDLQQVSNIDETSTGTNIRTKIILRICLKMQVLAIEARAALDKLKVAEMSPKITLLVSSNFATLPRILGLDES